MDELFKSIAAGAVMYEIDNEGNDNFSVASLEHCIELYIALCAGNKDAIENCIVDIENDRDEFGYMYFFEDDANTFLEKFKGE